MKLSSPCDGSVARLQLEEDGGHLVGVRLQIQDGRAPMKHLQTKVIMLQGQDWSKVSGAERDILWERSLHHLGEVFPNETRSFCIRDI